MIIKSKSLPENRKRNVLSETNIRTLEILWKMMTSCAILRNFHHLNCLD